MNKKFMSLSYHRVGTHRSIDFLFLQLELEIDFGLDNLFHFVPRHFAPEIIWRTESFLLFLFEKENGKFGPRFACLCLFRFGSNFVKFDLVARLIFQFKIGKFNLCFGVWLPRKCKKMQEKLVPFFSIFKIEKLNFFFSI